MRAQVAEVAGVHNNFHAVVGKSDPLQDGNGLIARSIVDEDVLVIICTDAFHHLPHPLVDFFHVRFFVVAGGYNTDGLAHDAITLALSSGAAPTRHRFPGPRWG